MKKVYTIVYYTGANNISEEIDNVYVEAESEEEAREYFNNEFDVMGFYEFVRMDELSKRAVDTISPNVIENISDISDYIWDLSNLLWKDSRLVILQQPTVWNNKLYK